MSMASRDKDQKNIIGMSGVAIKEPIPKNGEVRLRQSHQKSCRSLMMGRRILSQINKVTCPSRTDGQRTAWKIGSRGVPSKKSHATNGG